MYYNPQALSIIAKAREQEFLEVAEAVRVTRLLREGQTDRSTVWQQVRRQFGRVTIILDRQLQAQQGHS